MTGAVTNDAITSLVRANAEIVIAELRALVRVAEGDGEAVQTHVGLRLAAAGAGSCLLAMSAARYSA